MYSDLVKSWCSQSRCHQNQYKDPYVYSHRHDIYDEPKQQLTQKIFFCDRVAHFAARVRPDLGQVSGISNFLYICLVAGKHVCENS